MLLTIIEILAALGALALCFGTGSFEGLSWLWQLPLFFLGLGIGMVLAVVGFILVWSLFTNPEKPVEKEKPWQRALIQAVCGAGLRLLHVKLDVSGMEKLPKEGRIMLVCNHLHIIDPVFLLHCFRKSQLAFVAKKESRSMFLVGRIIHCLQCQYINRENDREALMTILKCIELIKEDKASIGVFPEGYCSADGKLQPMRNGVFKIAQRTQVPVVVCTLRGTTRVFSDFLHFRRPHVILELVDVLDTTEPRLTTKELGDRVHELMAKSLGDSVG